MLTAVSVARDCGMIGPSHKVERSPFLSHPCLRLQCRVHKSQYNYLCILGDRWVLTWVDLKQAKSNNRLNNNSPCTVKLVRIVPYLQ